MWALWVPANSLKPGDGPHVTQAHAVSYLVPVATVEFPASCCVYREHTMCKVQHALTLSWAAAADHLPRSKGSVLLLYFREKLADFTSLQALPNPQSGWRP